jgi:hypothetical protein
MQPPSFVSLCVLGDLCGFVFKEIALNKDFGTFPIGWSHARL